MKKQKLIQEVKRFQKLAGILNENKIPAHMGKYGYWKIPMSWQGEYEYMGEYDPFDDIVIFEFDDENSPDLSSFIDMLDINGINYRQMGSALTIKASEFNNSPDWPANEILNEMEIQDPYQGITIKKQNKRTPFPIFDVYIDDELVGDAIYRSKDDSLIINSFKIPKILQFFEEYDIPYKDTYFNDIIVSSNVIDNWDEVKKK